MFFFSFLIRLCSSDSLLLMLFDTRDSIINQSQTIYQTCPCFLSPQCPNESCHFNSFQTWHQASGYYVFSSFWMPDWEQQVHINSKPPLGSPSHSVPSLMLSVYHHFLSSASLTPCDFECKLRDTPTASNFPRTYLSLLVTAARRRLRASFSPLCERIQISSMMNTLEGADGCFCPAPAGLLSDS